MEINERILEKTYWITISNEECSKQLEKVIELGKKIMENLGPNRLLFLQYQSLAGMLHKNYLENTYRAGFEDGKNH